MKANARPILVIGGGVSGMTAAVEAAEAGGRVILVEKEPFLGGRAVRTHRYFPKMCPPTCGYEINVRRIRQNPRIDVHTLATVEDIGGAAGDFQVRIKVRPRYVTGRYTLDDALAEQLTGERDNEVDFGMSKTKALYRTHDTAYPTAQVLDRAALTDADAELLLKNTPPGSIDLDMQEREFDVQVSSIIVATGWRPYDATKLEPLGFGRHENVIINVMMERLASPSGPTGGEILRPSDGKPAQNVAFVQCAGSRDENHLSYCSAVCCMASLKQIRYLREKNETAKATVFYIDIRTIGRLEKFYFDMLDDENVSFVKGKVAEISEDPNTKDLQLDVEDTLSRELLHGSFDMVVLATGMVPNTADVPIPLDLNYDAYGFLEDKPGVRGVYPAGLTKRPCDVSGATKSATAAALRAIQGLNEKV